MPTKFLLLVSVAVMVLRTIAALPAVIETPEQQQVRACLPPDMRPTAQCQAVFRPAGDPTPAARGQHYNTPDDKPLSRDQTK